jgi:hypothetical protein
MELPAELDLRCFRPAGWEAQSGTEFRSVVSDGSANVDADADRERKLTDAACLDACEHLEVEPLKARTAPAWRVAFRLSLDERAVVCCLRVGAVVSESRTVL